MLGRLRAAGRLPVRLRVPGLAALRLLLGQAGRGDPALSSSFPPSRGQGRGAPPGSKRPAPAGNNGRGLKRLCGRGAWKTASECRTHGPRASRACVPRAGGLSVCPAARPLWPARSGSPAAAERSPAARRAYISGRLPRSALRQRSAPAPRNIHEAAAARGLP